MLIENPDAFKSWLTSILEPLCDADPAALAKYVYALVKKDKPLDDLREGMLDQLDVFLQHETKPFVELLFRSLETQEYLKVSRTDVVPDSEMVAPGCETQEDALQPETNGTAEETARVEASVAAAAVAAAPRHRVVLSRPPRHAATAPQPPPPPPPQPHQQQQQQQQQQRGPHYEQTLVKVVPLNELLNEPIDVPRRRERRADSLKEKDERRRRRSRSWDRTRRRRPAWRNASPPHQPHQPPLSSRYEKRRGGGGGGGSRSPTPARGRYRNRSPPGAAHAHAHPPPDRAPSRSRSRSPIPMRERERDRERDSRMSRERDRMSRDREHRDRVSRERERDRDREGRERERSRDRSRERSPSAGTPTQDSNPEPLPPPLPSVTQLPAHKRRCRDFDEKGYCMRGDLCQWDHGADPVVLEDAALSRVLTMAPPVPEYNPLAPEIWGGGIPPPYPYPHPHLPHLPHPARELVPIPRIREAAPAAVGGAGGVAMVAAMPRPHGPHHKPFDFNRLGSIRPNMGPNAANCSLEVKKVPRGMNDIAHLNNHFSKFGKIVNIQVGFEGDPEAALITFSSHTEANVAYKSTEAVLNNRFIKVFWHNPESKQENVPPNGSGVAGLHAGHGAHGGHGGHAHAGQPHAFVTQNKQLINNRNIAQTKLNKLSAAAAAAAADKQETKAEGAGAGAGAGGKEPEPKPLSEKESKQKQISLMHRRAQTLLETQLQQQMLLIHKLESGDVSGAQREALMEAIQSAQEGIEKLRKELLAYNKVLQAAQAETAVARSLGLLQITQVKKPRTREEAQKEILDMELDIFTKQQEGVDVTDLLKKVGELRRQMALQYPSHPASRRGMARGARFNSATRFVRGAVGAGGGAGALGAGAPKLFVNQSVDHRPRALLISGFEADELDGVTQHFAQFGEIVGKEVRVEVPELTVQYRARAHAELAAARARHYNDRTLSVTWVSGANTKPLAPPQPQQQQPPPPAAQPRPAPGAAENGASTDKDVAELDKHDMSEEALLRDDEEDEDDAEERSWRR